MSATPNRERDARGMAATAAWMALACMPCGAQSARDMLKVGDPAPPLTAVEWLKGEPVTRFERGQLYVVVFSATWCPTSRKAIPYLTRLAGRYAARLTLVEFFTWQEGTKEARQDSGYVDQVRYLMESMGTKMDLDVAVDDPQQTSAAAWRIAGVPTAFVVDRDGAVAWIGAPTALDPVLRQMLAGSFDPVATAARQEAFNASLERIRQLGRTGGYRQTASQLDALIAIHPQDSSLYALKYRVLAGNDDARADTLLEWLLKADIPGFDWDHFVPLTYGLSGRPNYELALAAVDRAVARSETGQVAAGLLARKLDIHLARSRSRSKPAQAKGDIARAAAALERAFELSRLPGAPANARLAKSLRRSRFKVWAAVGDARANALLRSLLHDNEPGTRWTAYVDAALEHQRFPDYGLLLDVAQRAVTQAGREEGWDKSYALSVKAEVYAARGDMSRAIATYQQVVKAAKLGGDTAALERYEQRLADLDKNYHVQ